MLKKLVLVWLQTIWYVGGFSSKNPKPIFNSELAVSGTLLNPNAMHIVCQSPLPQRLSTRNNGLRCSLLALMAH